MGPSIVALAFLAMTVACGGSTSADGGAGSGGGSGIGGSSGSGGGSGSGGSSGSSSGSGGGSGGSSGSGGGGGSEACFGKDGSIPSVPYKLCQNSSDCVIVKHAADCCGNGVYVGVAMSEMAAAAVCEMAWVDTLPSCGCPAGPATAEDGKTPASPDKVIVECTNFTSGGGICKTRVP